MTTKQGERCKREAETAGIGFCWQHVPAESSASREKWKLGIESAALVVCAAELIIKVGELAVQYLPEFFGDGDPDESGAKNRLSALLFDAPIFPDLPECYSPGSRVVGWKDLEEFVKEAVWIRDNPAKADSQAIRWLESKFSNWYESLDEYHKNILGSRILDLSEKTRADNDT